MHSPGSRPLAPPRLLGLSAHHLMGVPWACSTRGLQGGWRNRAWHVFSVKTFLRGKRFAPHPGGDKRLGLAPAAIKSTGYGRARAFMLLKTIVSVAYVFLLALVGLAEAWWGLLPVAEDDEDTPPGSPIDGVLVIP